MCQTREEGERPREKERDGGGGRRGEMERDTERHEDRQRMGRSNIIQAHRK